MGSIEKQTSGPECYVRINVSKTTKGYSYETTISLRWVNVAEHNHFTGDDAGVIAGFTCSMPNSAGEVELVRLGDVLDDLNHEANLAARREITRRQAEDGTE